MRNSERVVAGLLGAIALACGPTAPRETTAGTITEMASGVEDKVTGGGQFVHPLFGTVTFSFVAQRHADGRVSGRFLQNQHDLGFIYQGDVTCFAVDPANHRAWIGGVLTRSNDPDPVTQVGDDAWFRVLDSDGLDEASDRSTFMGFEMPPPLDTSEHYCQAQIWPEGNARTWPVVHGNIVIH